MNHSKHDLLYMLEKVKAACSREYGVYHSYSDSDEHDLLLQLETDGLVHLYNSDDETGHYMWDLP